MEVPKKLGKYEIVSEIDRGSMGTVYLGYDPYVDRNVAIKVAHAAALNNKESGERFKKMFFNEAHTAGKLTHPNIVSIYDAGVDEDHHYIVMELIQDGDTLKTFCTPDNMLPLDQAIEIIFKCAKALDYAHKEGVIHRDIKPSNILIKDDKEVQIADFSIAKIKKVGVAETQVSGFMGSPRYMSPEQLNERGISHQTDLFSLGIVMYELLTGEHPFSGETFSQLVNQILYEEPTPLKEIRSDLPSVLTKIFAKSIQKDVKNRYQSGLEFALDLSHAFDKLREADHRISEQERFNAVKAIAFFQGFPESEIREVIKTSSYHTYEMKGKIILEGEVDDCFYIIVEGEVGVLKNKKPVRILEAGDCFGEMGYLTKAKRTATIKALTKTVLLKINATNMAQLPLACQVRFLKVFLRTLVNRLSMTTGESVH
ncbi:Serine/threonine protein kinase PrkC, regulator of stationary phase [uncultured Candidatus Thioglobus sp.]|nr:Serine/threonine protein kinase PrkC, regulator of stationary phase [uncultured Candidatus Thioglobus sp.]